MRHKWLTMRRNERRRAIVVAIHASRGAELRSLAASFLIDLEASFCRAFVSTTSV